MTDEKNDAQESEGESPAANNVSSQDARAEKPKEETRKPVASQPPPLWPLGVATIFAAFFVVLVLWIIFPPRAHESMAETKCAKWRREQAFLAHGAPRIGTTGTEVLSRAANRPIG